MKVAGEPKQPAGYPKLLKRSLLFRYYIHDSVDTFRIELVGELTASEVEELTGCCQTASATIRRRQVVLDVRRLKSVDEGGRSWLSNMAAQGARYAANRRREKGFILSETWTPGPEPAPRVLTLSCRTRLWFRSLFSTAKSKEQGDVDVPWADCRS